MQEGKHKREGKHKTEKMYRDVQKSWKVFTTFDMDTPMYACSVLGDE